MKITLSKPPALNHLYGNNKWGGKYLKPEGEAWKKECVLKIKSEGYDPYEDEVYLYVDLFTCRHQDNDNILKILMDSIQESGIIKNDYQIFDLRVVKHKVNIKKERVEISLGAL